MKEIITETEGSKKKEARQKRKGEGNGDVRRGDRGKRGMDGNQRSGRDREKRGRERERERRETKGKWKRGTRTDREYCTSAKKRV